MQSRSAGPMCLGLGDRPGVAPAGVFTRPAIGSFPPQNQPWMSLGGDKKKCRFQKPKSMRKPGDTGVACSWGKKGRQ